VSPADAATLAELGAKVRRRLCTGRHPHKVVRARAESLRLLEPPTLMRGCRGGCAAWPSRSGTCA